MDDPVKIIKAIRRLSRMNNSIENMDEIVRLMDQYSQIQLNDLHRQISNILASSLNDEDSIYNLIISIQNLKINNNVQSTEIKE
jgi:hypothetical protein